MPRIRRRLLFLFPLMAAGCSQGDLNLEVTSLLTDPADPLFEHAEKYLEAHDGYDRVAATLACEEGTEACLLRIDANMKVREGSSSSLILYVATGVQPLPGPVDLSGVYQYDVEPVSYATTEEVGTEDVARRYDYGCRYKEGTLSLEGKPEVGVELTGQLDLIVECVTPLVPDAVVPAELRGTFSTTVEEALY